MRFLCPFCSFPLNEISMDLLGRKISCPNCQQMSILPATAYSAGRVIGNDFHIEKKIGSGSIGIVFQANQLSLGRVVALKILNRTFSTEAGMSAFLYEARQAAKLDHINIVKCFAVGEEDGVFYMAMSFIKGETLKDRLARDVKKGLAMPVDEALHVVQQVAEGLHYAWEEAELIHRDIKPENIMIDEEGVVKLTDLGLALRQSDWDENMEISGSPSYMSPESFTGKPLDTRSDIYSLGITLFQLISGHFPFEANTVKAIAKKHFHAPVPELTSPLETVSPDVVDLVDSMLAKDPAHRPLNMGELLSSIWKIRQKTAPDPDMIPGVHTISIKRLDYDLQRQSLQHNIRRRKALYPLLILLLLLLCAGIGLAITLVMMSKDADSNVASKIKSIDSGLSNGSDDMEHLEDICSKLEADLLRSASDSIARHLAEASTLRRRILSAKYDKTVDELKIELNNSRKEVLSLAARFEQVTRDSEYSETLFKDKKEKLDRKVKLLSSDLEAERKRGKEMEARAAELEKKAADAPTVKEKPALVQSELDDKLMLLSANLRKGSTRVFKDIWEDFIKALDPSFKEQAESLRPCMEDLFRFSNRFIKGGAGFAGVESENIRVIGGDTESVIIAVGKLEPKKILIQNLKCEMAYTLAKAKIKFDAAASATVGVADPTTEKPEKEGILEDQKIKISAAFFTGDITGIDTLVTWDKPAERVAKALMTYEVRNLEIQSFLDKNKASAQAQSMLRRFAGLKVFEPFKAKVEVIAATNEGEIRIPILQPSEKPSTSAKDTP